MIRRIATYSLLALLSIACREQVEPQIVAGYIVGDATEEQITIENDTLPATTYRLTEQTIIEGGALTEGNIAEIIFLPTEEPSAQPYAERVTADKTYPQALGRWITDKNASLKIDIELLPHGNIAHHSPHEVLRFERWQITDRENEIVLYGTLSLPPDWSAYNEARKKDKETPLPQRREREFRVEARLDKQSDNNTESRRVMIFNTDNKEARLYFQQ